MKRQRNSTPDQFRPHIKLDRFAFALHISLKRLLIITLLHSLASFYEHRKVEALARLPVCLKLNYAGVCGCMRQ